MIKRRPMNVPMNGDFWPIIIAGLNKPWARESCLFDLRWWRHECLVNGKKPPSRRTLTQRWGWSERRVRDLVDLAKRLDKMEGSTAYPLPSETYCPVCRAAPGQGCMGDNGIRHPPNAGMHAGRLTGGRALRIRHTGTFTEDGAGVFETVDHRGELLAREGAE